MRLKFKINVIFIFATPKECSRATYFVVIFSDDILLKFFLLDATDRGLCPLFLDLFQTKQINFTVHAIVTTTDLVISPAEINFGYCTIYEAVRTNVTLTNKSILPQEFGFVRLPDVGGSPEHSSSCIILYLIIQKLYFNARMNVSELVPGKQWNYCSQQCWGNTLLSFVTDVLKQHCKCFQTV